MKTRRGKSGGNLPKFFIAIAIPILAVASLLYLSYAPRGPDVYGLPSDIPFQMQEWMSYVPQQATLVKFYNFSEINSSPGASYAIQSNVLLQDYDTKSEVNVSETVYSFEVGLGPTSVVDAFFLKPTAAESFLSGLSQAGGPRELGGYMFYTYHENSSRAILTFATFRGEFVFQATGGPSAYQKVITVLAAHDNKEASFFSSKERHTEVYLIGSTEHRTMAFSVLPNTTAAGTHEWVTAVYNGEDTIDLVNFYAYSTQGNATALFSTAQTQILSPNFARDYVIGNFIAQSRSFPWVQARTPMNSL